MRTWTKTILAGGLTLMSAGTMAFASPGAVYTASNGTAGNAILVFDRSADGQLTPRGSVPTGGLGTGDALGNQGGLVMTDDGKFLLAVNAGSNDVSVLQATEEGLTLRDRAWSGGLRPISVTVSGRLVYVLNAGGASGGIDAVVGFRLSREGTLAMIPGSARGLSAPSTNPAEVSLSPDGGSLVVTEKATNIVDIFDVENDGRLGASMAYPSSGITPFGFAFGKRDQFFVSEAFGGAPNGSAISSYVVSGAATLSLISPSVPTTETAACWVAVSQDGRYLYTTNAGSGSVSGYTIRPDGTISLLDVDGVTGVTGPGVTDVTLSNNGQYLYALRSGAGAIASFRVDDHGTLTPLDPLPIGPGTNGIVAR